VFPCWFLRIECDRRGKMRMIAETHMPAPDAMMLRDILHRMRHDGCGGLAAKAELLTGIEGASSRSVRHRADGLITPESRPPLQDSSARLQYRLRLYSEPSHRP
jgi:hypothetical protein